MNTHSTIARFPQAAKQSGAVLLLLFFVLFMAGASVLLTSLNTNDVGNRRRAATSEALQEAKQALIGFAVLYGDYYGAAGAGPGHLPCPDTDNDGIENTPCPGTALGRLPESIILPSTSSVHLSEYNQGIDQQFWYAVSNGFQGNPAGIVNSASTGNLTLNTQGGIAALLIAPGAAHASQVRPDSAVADYLDGANTTTPDFVSSAAGDFNDVVLPIYVSEIMSPATTRVAEVIKIELDNYHTTNGFYPADQATFDASLLTEPAWFDSNSWNTQVSYTQVDANNANFVFTGCTITYTVTSGVASLSKSSSTC